MALIINKKTTLEKKAASFFSDRAFDIKGSNYSVKDLCYVSGRDYRLWAQQDMYEDLVHSIKFQLDIHSNMSLLEVGCAAGFLAKGLSEACSRYVGVDCALNAIKISKSLKLSNAIFKKADATNLPFESNSFERAISYDVFTNFQDFTFAEKVISEMLRVVKNGGKVMIGSLADSAFRDIFPGIVLDVGKNLDEQFGTQSYPEVRKTIFESCKRWFRKRWEGVEPEIICFDFNREDFLQYGEQHSLQVEILDIHPLNPYSGYRFNVIYTKE